MKAAVYQGINDIKIKDIPSPQLNRGEVLVKVKASSICGTDKKIYNHGYYKIGEDEEVILGHEIAGEIVETGKDVNFYKEGMRVVVVPVIGCGYCDLCQQGKEQLCSNFNAFGINWDGGFAEYVKIPAQAVRRGNLIKVPDDIDLTEAPLIEPLACCFNGYKKLNPGPGDTLLIFGAGPMGNFNLLLNKHLEAGKIIMVDIEESRLEFSQKLGADYTVKSDEVEEKVAEITGGQGVDSVITAAPVPQVQQQALDLVGAEGKVNFFAGLTGDQEMVELDTQKIHYQELKIVGTTGSTRADFIKTIKLIQAADIDIGEILTKKISLEELDDVMANKELLKNNMKINVVFD